MSNVLGGMIVGRERTGFTVLNHDNTVVASGLSFHGAVTRLQQLIRENSSALVCNVQPEVGGRSDVVSESPKEEKPGM